MMIIKTHKRYEYNADLTIMNESKIQNNGTLHASPHAFGPTESVHPAHPSHSPTELHYKCYENVY